MPQHPLPSPPLPSSTAAVLHQQRADAGHGEPAAPLPLGCRRLAVVPSRGSRQRQRQLPPWRGRPPTSPLPPHHPPRPPHPSHARTMAMECMPRGVHRHRLRCARHHRQRVPLPASLDPLRCQGSPTGPVLVQSGGGPIDSSPATWSPPVKAPLVSVGNCRCTSDPGRWGWRPLAGGRLDALDHCE